MTQPRLASLYAMLLRFLNDQAASLKIRLLISALGGIAWLIGIVLLQSVWGPAGLLVGAALTITLGLFVAAGLLACVSSLASSRLHDERNLQALLGIYSVLSPRAPLPYFRNAALGADTCLEYIRHIKRAKPRLIVELGSGTSTLVAGYMVRQNGAGRVIALDHDEKWGALTRAWLEEHGLDQQCEIRIAPLTTVLIGDKRHEWYDPASLEGLSDIDLLLIDGPPDHYGVGTRYAALPLLGPLIAENGCIVVDDCIMPVWEKLVIAWARSNNFIVAPMYLNEKKAVILRRASPASIRREEALGKEIFSIA